MGFLDFFKKKTQSQVQDASSELTLAQEAGLPDNWHPIDSVPINPNQPGGPPMMAWQDRFTSGPLPPNFGLATDLVATGYPSHVPSIRLMPIVNNAALGAQIQSQSAKIAQDTVAAAIAAIPPTTPTTDGLIHGTTPWETDPSSVIMVDDFVSGNKTSGQIGALGWTANGTALTGLSSGGFPNSGSVYMDTPVSANGGTSLTPVDPAQQLTSIRVPVGFPITYNTGWDCSFVFRWPSISLGSSQTNVFTKVRLYLGFAVRSIGASVNRPAKFCGLRFDTDPGTSFTLSAAANASGGTTVYTGTFAAGGSNAFSGFKFTVAGFSTGANNGTFMCQASSTTTITLVNASGVSESHAASAATPAISDSSYVFECVQNGVDGNNVQGTTFTTAISPDNNLHRFRMRSIVQGQILFSIDGGTEYMLSISTDTYPSGYTTAGMELSVTGNNLGTGNTNVRASGSTVQWFSAPCWRTPSVLSGCTGGAAVLNGTFNISDGSPAVANGPAYQNSGVNSAATQTATTIAFTWYNAFYPMIFFGNDSQGTPSSASIEVDFFGFVYNPGLATDFAQTANPTLPRFFNGQT